MTVSSCLEVLRFGQSARCCIGLRGLSSYFPFHLGLFHQGWMLKGCELMLVLTYLGCFLRCLPELIIRREAILWRSSWLKHIFFHVVVCFEVVDNQTTMDLDLYMAPAASNCLNDLHHI